MKVTIDIPDGDYCDGCIFKEYSTGYNDDYCRLFDEFVNGIFKCEECKRFCEEEK